MKSQPFAFASAFLMVVGLWLVPAASHAQPVRPTLLVMLQNDANVESDLAAKAQSEVTRLFDLIDVDLLWVTEVPAAGTRLRVVSVTTWEPPDKIPASVLGYTQVRSRQARDPGLRVLEPCGTRLSEFHRQP